jgi:integrase
MLGLGKSARTAYIYCRLINQAEVFLEARGKTLLDAGPVDVAALADTVRKSHSSRGQLRAALVAAWEVLDRRDGPVRAVRVPPRPRGRCRALEVDTAELLERAAWDRNDDAGLAVLIGLYTALRRFEIAALCWEDLEADERGRLAWIHVMGKGDVADVAAIHPVLEIALLRRRRPAGPMFQGRWGGPVVADTIWRWTVLVGLDAGLKVTTHMLRHTALAEANDRSGDLRTVQAIARHSRPETTSIYTRTNRARIARVTSMIDYGRRLDGQEEVA